MPHAFVLSVTFYNRFDGYRIGAPCNLSTGILRVTIPHVKIGTGSPLDLARKFHFVGGALPLDFCNTVGGKRGAETREHLCSPVDYVAWSHQAGLLGRAQAEQCLRRAEHRPAEAVAALRRATELREALFRIFAAASEGRTAALADLDRLNSELAYSLGRLRLRQVSGGRRFDWEWAAEPGTLDHPLGPVARAAADLLADPHQLRQVGVCHGDNCGWLFLDSSKNHSRRWCDMRDCGNRAKIRRHRLRHRLAGDT